LPLDLRSIRIEPLGAQHDRAGFSCGVAALDAYLQQQAGQDARRRIAAPFVAVGPEETLLGYYTLSATSIQLADLPAALTKQLPRYPRLPATLLGRLATSTDARGVGLGRFLLVDAMHRALRSEIASFAFVVDAKDEVARRFYERESFLPLSEKPNRLVRRMADIAALFEG
jgi:predicted GNAT family N-acyltransferase